MKQETNLTFTRVGDSWYFPEAPFFLPVVSGGDGDGGDGGDGDGGNGGGAEGEGKGKEKLDLTQEDLNRITANEKRQGKESGKRELLKQLGFENPEDAEAAVKAHREAQEKDKSEAQKAREAADKEREEAQAEKLEAKKEKFVSKCERALLAAECPAETVEKVARLVDLKVEDDPTQDDIVEAVEALKKEMPQLFAKKEERGNKHSDTGTGSRQGGGQKSTTEQAKDLLASRHPSTVKT